MQDLRDEIVRLLTNIGGMSMAELARLIGEKRIRVQKAVRVLRNRRGVYVLRYERQPDGVKGRCTPVYAVGPGEDAKPPTKRSRADTCKRYYKRHSASISARRYTKQREQLGVWRGLV